MAPSIARHEVNIAGAAIGGAVRGAPARAATVDCAVCERGIGAHCQLTM
jgi:hypothetical protein